MGLLYVDTLEPQSGTTLTVGETGQNTVVGGNTIKFNTLQDAGGNAIFTSNGSGVLSSVNSSFGSDMNLISSQTVTDGASISFTSGITSTYGEYIFKCYNINPATDGTELTFNASTPDIPIANGKEYTIADIKVTGSSNYSENTVITFTGLRVGEKIYIPGDRMSNVIKKLWDLGLFSDINFYTCNIDASID